MPRRTAIARFVLGCAVLLAVVVATLPGVASGAVELFRAGVAALRGVGHGLLSVEDGFVTAAAVTLVVVPLPALVAAAGRGAAAVAGWRASVWAAVACVVVVSIRAAQGTTPGPTWVSGVLASAVGVLLGCLLLAALRTRAVAPTPRSRRLATTLLALYGIGVLLVGFWGSPVDAGAHPGILRVLDLAHRAGLPLWFGYGALEFTANVLFFVPLGLLVVLRLGTRAWWAGAAAGLVVSAAIEVGQALFLPARFASLDDVLANTSGAVIGAMAGVVLLGLRGRRTTAGTTAPGTTKPRRSAAGR
ncbi:VanZ family protein [Curtobacterium sp. MCLR17_007]|uniref:VanZ family protein n=1 Tax=Curtobacterium sp. MCLR17_007 TaxID=2175648 RepID=UPI000DA76505|nr:VanZ family protein [Curtobacterium sp. MCLR17_007]WIB62049.1 VanZ family protein [Curtobacterium sp. MCLR17_007]